VYRQLQCERKWTLPFSKVLVEEALADSEPMCVVSHHLEMYSLIWMLGAQGLYWYQVVVRMEVYTKAKKAEGRAGLRR
jgi:hypothetical protein